MRALIQAVEAGAPALDGCALLRPLHRSSLFDVDLWRCVEDGAALRAERRRSAPVLTVLLSGVSVLRFGGRELLIEAGTVLLGDGHAPYSSAHPFGCGDMGCHIRPSTTLMLELRLPETWGYCADSLPPRALLRFRLAVESASRDGGDRLELEEACLGVLAAMPAVRVHEELSHTALRHLGIVEEAKGLLLRRLGDRLTLSDVASELDVSPFHLARVFRRRTGYSLHAYRTRMRLLRALDVLEESRGALTDLALELGFSSQSHFTDTFRRTFGISPGAAARDSLRSRTPQATP